MKNYFWYKKLGAQAPLSETRLSTFTVASFWMNDFGNSGIWRFLISLEAMLYKTNLKKVLGNESWVSEKSRPWLLIWTHLKRNNDLTRSHDKISSNNSPGKYKLLLLEFNVNLDLLNLRPHLHFELDIIVDWLLLVFDWNPYS